MKLTKQSNRMKSRIVSFTVAIALILCAVLSLGYILPDRIARAEDGDPPAAKVTDGIRFVQVAAGYDFAIGLTYDRKLYGWSTKKSPIPNGTSLGDYYSWNPTEIKVTFRQGPGDGGAYKWGNTGTTPNYHTPRKDDQIKAIAATAHTAAFVTEKGYLYTWGNDTADVDHREFGGTNYLLLRATDSSHPWQTPYIIDYHYYCTANEETSTGTNKPSTEQMIPTIADSVTSLAAGEYNYIFMFDRFYPTNGNLSNTSGNMYHTYVWGSGLYSAINKVPNTEFSYDSADIEIEQHGRKVFNTFISDSNKGVTAVAGGYTVGINNTAATVTNGTSLQLHGKNFITTQGVTGSGNDYSLTNTARLVTSAEKPATIDITAGAGADKKTYKAAIAGGNGGTAEDGKVVGQNPEQYYAYQYGSVKYNLGSNSDGGFLINSKSAGAGNDNRISKYTVEDSEQDALKPTRYAVSLGNDIGYGIVTNSGVGRLYGWGDNAHGQLTGVTGSKNEPTQLLSSVNFYSVAAGKQKSKEARAFFSNTTTFNGTSFADDVQNDDKYITGALASDGSIYVWSKGIPAKQMYYMGLSGTGKKESFAAVYSGYGENLYAVTVSGKLVRITKSGNDDDYIPAGGYTQDGFVQYVYDEFYTKDSQDKDVKITNWTVDSTNKVVFNVPAVDAEATIEQKASPNLGNATFYVWSASTNGEVDSDEQPYIKVNGGAQTAYKPLVSENKIGDAYRIVGLTETDASINYLKADNLTADANQLTYYAPKFYFVTADGSFLMTEKQQQNMFTFREVYGDNGEGVGIYIAPKQSSKGKDIRVEFYIARYNNYDKFSNVANGDNAIYYDYKQCSITFSIADTPSVVKYSAFASEEDGGKSNIPLLDPNNPYNTHYSLAVQDVSTGVNELIKFLTGSTNTVNQTFKTAVMTEMKKDKGFPDSAKVEQGDLTYYLNTEDLKKYNYDVGTDGGTVNTIADNDNVYQYIYTDRDAERIMLVNSGTNTSMMASSAKGVDGKIETITVKVEYLPTSYGITGVNANLTTENFGANLLKTISTDFDNRFGLYNFKYTTESGKNYLSFDYDVLTFTATDSSGTIAYEGTGNASVTGYNTAAAGGRAASSFRSYTLNNNFSFDNSKGYVAQTTYDRNTPSANVSNFAYVYSMPSLRLKSTVKADSNGQASGSKNTYTETRADKTNNPLYVGDTTTINLSNYVDKTDTANVISFSFNNKADTTELGKFSSQFQDYSGHNMSVVSLTGNTIYVHPTTAGPINFTVEIQRFADVNKSRIFTAADSKVDEKIYLTFNFNNIVGFEMIDLSDPDREVSRDTNAKVEYDVTQSITIDLFGESDGANNAGSPFIDLVRVNTDGSLGGSLKNTSTETSAGRAYAALKAGAQIYGISSSEDGKDENEQLFTYTDLQNSTNKTKFTITPKRSGSGTLLFLVNIYDKSVSFKLDINVSAVTELGDNNKITIIDDQYISISELDVALRSANSFNPDVQAGKYRILYNDPTAIMWEDKDGNPGKPPFVEKVVFEGLTSEPTIRLVSSNSTTQQSKTYYMYVRYTNAGSGVTKYEDAPAGSIIQIVVPVVCGKIKLQASTGGDLVAAIDCRNIDKNNWWTQSGDKLDTRVTIDLQYLLNLDGTEAPDKYKIFLLSADSAATEYFQYDKGAGDRSIQITPKMNTPKNFELNVSVYKEGENTTKVLSFEVSVGGILTVLPVMTDDDGIIGYGNIWIYSAAIVFGVLFIIFMIRFIVYMRRRSKQRAIIKRNQELIRLRDRMHGKANAATREQLVKSKLKMENPKYAKMFNDMRRDKEDESGVALVNSDLAATADKKTKKKKKGGKKSVAELKAELAAKKAAFAAAQAGNAQPVNPFATEVPLDGGFVAPDGGFADGGGYAQDGGFADGGGYAADGGFADGGFADGGFADGGAQSIDGSEIIFDASDMGDGNM